MATADTSVLELSIERPVAGGRMLARHEGRVVLVSGGVPGERVRARVERVRRQTTWATVVDVIEPSPDRREPPCDPACGGSAYAYLAYPRQLQCKAEIVADAFRRIGKISLEAPVEVAASPEQGYRLRGRLHVRQRQAGFFREGTHVLCDPRPTGQLLPETMTAIDGLLSALANRLADVDEFIVAENVPATERVVHVVPKNGVRLDDLLGHLRCPDGITGITTIVRGQMLILDGAAVVTDTSEQLFAGATPPVPAVSWARHASSFFQGNRFLIGALVRRVLERSAGERF